MHEVPPLVPHSVPRDVIEHAELLLRDFRGNELAELALREFLGHDLDAEPFEFAELDFEYWTFDEISDVDFYKEVFSKFYLIFNPEKFSDVERLMVKYKGWEKELYDAIRTKYEPLGPSPKISKKVSFADEDPDYESEDPAYESLAEAMFIQLYGLKAFDESACG